MIASPSVTERPPASGRRHHPPLLLPYGWPIYALCYGFPIWWVLGLAEFIWPILGFAMLLSLTMRREKIRVPKGIGAYVLFLMWAAVSVIGLAHGGGTATAAAGSTADKIVGFAYRFFLYCSAPVFGLYIFNAPKRLLSNKSIVHAMVFFWVVVVGGGFLGLLLPHLQLTTVMARVIPKHFQGNSFVYNLVHPKTAQVQSFLGFPVPRPSAPFVFTNDWGGNFALLFPFLLAAWTENHRIARNPLVRLLVPLSMIPVIFSLNRTLWGSLALIAVYGGIRFGARRQVMTVIRGAFVIALVGGMLAFVGPIHTLISERVAHGHSNQGRSLLYASSINLALQKPLLGWGGPQQATVDAGFGTKSNAYKHPDVGTQGQFWTILVSNGMPATALFFGYLFFAVWQTRRSRSGLGLWCHIVVLVAIFQSPFYGLLSAQLHIVFIAIALAYRDACEPDPEPDAPLPGRTLGAPQARPVLVAVAGGAGTTLTGVNGHGLNGSGSSGTNGHAPHGT
ncbi:MAG TPA: O-antigen ligase family protein [Acidimicrobiia bacterium]|nr:O-antigen ligase family protein [Acidimicrobiia bacterium]